MKLAFNLAYKNLIKAGLRTWLNVGILSFTFVMIIFFNSLLDGWNAQSRKDSIDWEYGYGQLQHKAYDPFDSFSLKDGHGAIPLESKTSLTPILIQQATIYPQGRMMPISLKGIPSEQQVLKLPTHLLQEDNSNPNSIPVFIGKRMATSAKLKINDHVLLRWRDKQGAFDAANVTIAGVFDSNVSTIDKGQIWISLKKMEELTSLKNQATLLVINKPNIYKGNLSDWNFITQEALLSELTELIEVKKSSNSILYLMLLAIALLAIFDTQVLSIFRRQKEIGTYISLGMLKRQVILLFTIEGSMYSLLAVVLGSIYGIPVFVYLANKGISIPNGAGDTGIVIADQIFPVYSFKLVAYTILLIVISSTIVSFIPAQKIAKMNPINALKGKI